MIVDAFGIQLVRLKEDHIEMVRQHRNSEKISSKMVYRETITPSMQKKWFLSVDNIYNSYFVIYADNKAVGLIYGAIIDWEKKETGNGGIFIWEEAALETKIPIAASLALTDTSVYLGLKRTFIRILNHNQSAIAYNKSLGYRVIPGSDDEISSIYVLEMEAYLEKSKRIKSTIFKEYKDQLRVNFDINQSAIEQFFYDKMLKAAITFPDRLILSTDQ